MYLLLTSDKYEARWKPRAQVQTCYIIHWIWLLRLMFPPLKLWLNHFGEFVKWLQDIPVIPSKSLLCWFYKMAFANGLSCIHKHSMACIAKTFYYSEIYSMYVILNLNITKLSCWILLKVKEISKAIRFVFSARNFNIIIFTSHWLILNDATKTIQMVDLIFGKNIFGQDRPKNVLLYTILIN